jgi:hypothetical protein
MIGRLLEDIIFVGRIGYFYHKAPRDIASVGFNPGALTRKQKVRYAWTKAQLR